MNEKNYKKKCKFCKMTIDESRGFSLRKKVIWTVCLSCNLDISLAKEKLHEHIMNLYSNADKRASAIDN